MKIITVADTASTPNMIRGIFATRKIPGVECVAVHSTAELLAALDEKSVVLVDWEREPAECAEYVYAVKTKLPKVPVLLLCIKQ
ncbi:MAG: hypothetical protein LBS30_03495, partial [Planctomycetota bacterium]|nr:hypothetical protein [Planctomycetota bacterium]